MANWRTKNKRRSNGANEAHAAEQSQKAATLAEPQSASESFATGATESVAARFDVSSALAPTKPVVPVVPVVPGRPSSRASSITSYSAGQPPAPAIEATIKKVSEAIVPQRQFNVYITGFGAWGETVINPSYLILEGLPAELPAIFLQSHLPAADVQVNLICYPKPVEVTYDVVDALIPEIHSNKDINLFVHIGVASGGKGYRIEKLARRGKYTKPDGNKKYCDPDNLGCGGLVPDEVQQLHSGVNLLPVLERFDRYKGGSGLEMLEKPYISNDPGLFLCEYIYFRSLAQAIFVEKLPPKAYLVSDLGKNSDARIRNEVWASRRVVFVHVPPETDDAALEIGRDTVMMIIGGMVLSSVSSVYTTGVHVSYESPFEKS